MADLEAVAADFRRFAEIELQGHDTPMYERLAAAVAEDEDLLELAAQCRTGQPRPNLLFGAVQYLLALHPEDALASHYPSVGPGPARGDLVAEFGRFCREHREAIVAVLRSRIVQTNEVGRSALLLPAFHEASRAAGDVALALIEIGPSVGLNLLFDAYGMDYGAQRAGDPGSPLVLRCDSVGGPLPLAATPPRVASRRGIDVNPLDPADDDDMRWLRALVWPEHHDRRARLDAAIAIARERPPRLLKGDVFDLLPREVEAVSPGTLPVVFATFVLNQFTDAMRHRLRALLVELASAREIAVVVLGGTEFVTGTLGPPRADVSLWLLRLGPGLAEADHLATCHPHGRWIRWGPEGHPLRWDRDGTIRA